jgi:hypothetical protein
MWLAVAGDGDWIWCPELVETGFWSRMEVLGCARIHACGPGSPPPPGLDLVPWGWSEEIRRLAALQQARVSAPPQDVVRLANSRLFSFAPEAEWGCGLAGSTTISKLSDAEEVLTGQTPDARWVLKCDYGAAARERILGQGPTPSPQAISWIRDRLDSGGSLFFEPWVERVDEAGMQWDIPAEGRPQLVGITPLLCDHSGNYLGSRFGVDAHHEWSEAIEISRRAVERIQRAGYFGPVGIDAMRYRDADGEVRLRPLQDINARWTMGRIALGWERVTPTGVWRHGDGHDLEAAPRPVIETAPRSVGGRPVEHCTWIEAGDGGGARG